LVGGLALACSGGTQKAETSDLGVEANLDQLCGASSTWGLRRKKEETLELISEENVRRNTAKPWISYRQRSVGSGTVLTCRELPCVLEPTAVGTGA